MGILWLEIILRSMNIETLFCFMKIRGISGATLARKAGISRQALTEWKRKAKQAQNPRVNVYSQTQESLAQVLGVRSEELGQTFQIISDPNLRKSIEAEILWDRLYPDIASFSSAVVKGAPQALARLVQVYGLYASAKMAGQQIWNNFPEYKYKMHPAYRKQAEIVWTLAQNQA